MKYESIKRRDRKYREENIENTGNLEDNLARIFMFIEERANYTLIVASIYVTLSSRFATISRVLNFLPHYLRKYTRSKTHFSRRQTNLDFNFDKTSDRFSGYGVKRQPHFSIFIRI